VFGGLYGGAAFDAIHLSGGALYAANDYSLNREVAFPGFAEALGSGYDGHTAQAFGEAGYRMDFGSAWVEPFVDLLAMQIHSDSFAENGGAAALIGDARSYDYGATTLGAKGEMALSSVMPLNVTGSLGWRHGYGEITPDADLAFESASASPFTVAGAPIARNSLVAETGISWNFAPHASAGLFYSGDIARGTYDNVIKAKIDIAF
jgi:outer membrane autotransporter protein